MLVLRVTGTRNFTIDTNSLTGWYYLFAPNSTAPKMVYHVSGQSRYAGYTTERPSNCNDPQQHLVGPCKVWFMCVEDLRNSSGTGENDVFAGFNLLNNLSGRSKTSVSALNNQRECFAFFNTEGRIENETDVKNCVFGQVIFRPIPSSKLIPQKTFGYPFECSWRDIAIEDLPSVGLRMSVGQVQTASIGASERELTVEVSATGDKVSLIFSKVVIGSFRISTGFEATLSGKEIHVTRKDPTLLSFTINLVESSPSSYVGWV